MINLQIAVIAIVSLNSVRLYNENRRIRQLNSDLVVIVEDLTRALVYFGDMLDRENVEMTEFDRIALLNIVGDLQKESP